MYVVFSLSLQHNNIVNFIDFWHDKVEQQDRVSEHINPLHPRVFLSYRIQNSL